MQHRAGAHMTAVPEAPSNTTRSQRWWPMRLAAGIALVVVVAMVVSVISWQNAEQSADDADAQVGAQAAEVDQLTDDRRDGEQRIADTQAEVQAMRAILQPGTPEALQVVYLQLVQAGCADPTADVETRITEVAADVSAGSTVLAGQPGWERAIDRDAVTEALADCGADNG